MYSYATISIGQLSSRGIFQSSQPRDVRTLTLCHMEIKASSIYGCGGARTWLMERSGKWTCAPRYFNILFLFLSLLLSVQQSNGIFTGAMQPGECRAGHVLLSLLPHARYYVSCACVCGGWPGQCQQTLPCSLDNNNIAAVSVWNMMRWWGAESAS